MSLFYLRLVPSCVARAMDQTDFGRLAYWRGYQADTRHPASNAAERRSLSPSASAPTIRRMSEPRDHHYVPQLLLREFAHGHARQWLWVYDKKTDVIFPGSVKKSAQRRNYNATARGDSTTDAELERIFAMLESDAAPALARLREAEVGLNTLDPFDRIKIAIFIAAQHVRVPAIRETAESGANLWAAMKIDRGLAHEPELLAEWRGGSSRPCRPQGSSSWSC